MDSSRSILRRRQPWSAKTNWLVLSGLCWFFVITSVLVPLWFWVLRASQPGYSSQNDILTPAAITTGVISVALFVVLALKCSNKADNASNIRPESRR